MTKDNNIRFVPSTPKTYEVKYVDLTVKESKITKLAGYLGIKTVENCDNGKQVSSSSSSSTVTKTDDKAEKMAAAVTKAMAEVAAKNAGDKVESKTEAKSGDTTITYHSNKK
jgi:predicted DNA-binding protein (UPF0251 family)